MEKENQKFSGDTRPEAEVKVESADLTGLIMDQAFQDEADRIINNTNVIDIEERSKEIESKKDMFGDDSLSKKENRTLNINDVRKGKYKDFFKKAITADISKGTKSIDVQDASKAIRPDVDKDSDNEETLS